jgi:Kelch motif
VRRLLPLLAIPLAACGASPHHAAVHASTGAKPSPTASSAPPRRLTLLSSRSLPAPVQLPALAVRGSEALAVGGLDAGDQSVSAIVRLAPGAPRVIGSLPQAVHDAGAATLSGRTFVFGGGTAAGPTDAIVALGSGAAGHLPAPSSDLEAVSLGSRILIVGGYTGTAPQRTVLAFRPGTPPQTAGSLPHPLRYAAAAAAGGRLIVAGGSDGTYVQSDIVAFDPATGRARRIGRLPHPIAHAGGAALDGTLYVFGGRGDSLASQRRTIYAIDPRTGRVRSAGRLPVALSDVSAVTLGDRILVAGGRDAAGRVHDELLEYGLR